MTQSLASSSQHTLDATRTIPFGPHLLEKPTLFASYRYGDYPMAGLKFHPWSITQTEGLLINAYDFLRPRHRNALEEDWCHETHLNFGNKPILVDSGAYYFLKHQNVDITPRQILDVEVKSRAHVGVVLDHPFLPGAPDRRERQKTTLRNTQIMLRDLRGISGRNESSMLLMPAVHGHTRRQIQYYLRELRDVVGPYGKLERVGIGSVAPLAKHGNAKLAAEIIHTVRRDLPDAHIHCFSMGSALLMLLAFYCGADTVDSQTWIVSAAFKQAQLPGHYTARMARRDYSSQAEFESSIIQPFCERLCRLAGEEGFTVRNWDVEDGEVLDLACPTVREQYAWSLVDETSNEHVHFRACHNLWTYNFDVRQVRLAIARQDLESFVARRLQETRYSKAFDYAKDLRNSGAKKRRKTPPDCRLLKTQATNFSASTSQQNI